MAPFYLDMKSSGDILRRNCEKECRERLGDASRPDVTRERAMNMSFKEPEAMQKWATNPL
jgi:hypothetical protein